MISSQPSLGGASIASSLLGQKSPSACNISEGNFFSLSNSLLSSEITAKLKNILIDKTCLIIEGNSTVFAFTFVLLLIAKEKLL